MRKSSLTQKNVASCRTTRHSQYQQYGNNEAGILLSLRQSNVIRSPRVYNSNSSVSLQNETLKCEGTLVNSARTKIQQVTVGPTESDSICDIFFEPHVSAIQRSNVKDYGSLNSLPSKVGPKLDQPYDPAHQRSMADVSRLHLQERLPHQFRDSAARRLIGDNSSSSNRLHPKDLHDSSPRQLRSHSNDFRKPYFERYSDTKPATTTIDVKLNQKRKPRHLASTHSTRDHNSREITRLDCKKYVPARDLSRERTRSVHHPVAQISSVPEHFSFAHRQNTSRGWQQVVASSGKPTSRSHKERQYPYSDAGMLKLPEYYTDSHYLLGKTTLHNRQHLKSPHESTKYLNSQRQKVYQRAPLYFDAHYNIYKGDGTMQDLRTHHYLRERSNESFESIDVDQSDVSQFESTNHYADDIASKYDVTIHDADREHCLNQNFLRKIEEKSALQRHPVGINYGSYIETRSDRSLDSAIQEKSSDELSSSDGESSSDSLHVSELDSNASDSELTSNPVKSAIKSHPAILLDDYKNYHKMTPVKQVHFKDPISVATTISNITLDELGMMSESSDHDIQVVELDDDDTLSHTKSLRHDKMCAELENKRLQDAGNTPKAARTKRPVDREMFLSELENKPSMIQSFEESSVNHENNNTELKNYHQSFEEPVNHENNNTRCENCSQYIKKHSLSQNLDTTLKISTGTNTELHLMREHQEQFENITPVGSAIDVSQSMLVTPSSPDDTLVLSRFPREKTQVNAKFATNSPYKSFLLRSNGSDETIASPENVSTSTPNDTVVVHLVQNGFHSKMVHCPKPDLQKSRLSVPHHTHHVSTSTPDETVVVQSDRLNGLPGRIFRNPNPPTCSVGSSDYRMMRLQAVIDCSPSKERQNIIIKSRYFQNWKDNVRLLVRIKKKEQRKLLRAETFYRVTALAKHFFSWRGFILEKQIRADEFHFRCMLKKGISALRWTIINRRIKTSQARLGRMKVKLNSCFRKWTSGYQARRVSKLHTLFFHWRRKLHENQIIAKIENNRRHKMFHRIFEIWHERFWSSIQYRISVHHHNLVLTQKVWHTWRIFTADQLMKASHREVAEVKFEFYLLTTSFITWKRMTRQKQSVQRYRNTKVLSSILRKWQRFTAFESLQHLKEWNLAKQTRRRCLLSRSLHVWTTRLQLVNFLTERETNTKRYCFLMWKSQLNRHLVIHAEVSAHRNLVLKKYVFVAFKQNANNQRHIRKNAIHEFKRNILQRHFQYWHLVAVQASKRCRGYVVVSKQREKLVLIQYFSTWVAKMKFREIQKSVKKQNVKTKRANAQRLLTSWKEEISRRRQTEDLLISGYVVERTLSLKQSTFVTWKEAFKNLERAKKFASYNIKRRLKIFLQEWHRIAESSIQAQLSSFAQSMMTQHKHIFKNKKPHRDWSMRNDIPDAESLSRDGIVEAKFKKFSLTNRRQGPIQNLIRQNPSVNLPGSRQLEISTPPNYCGDSGILSKDVTTATPSENDNDSSISITKDSIKSSKPSNESQTVGDFSKSQDSNIGTSVADGNNDASRTAQDSQSISSLSSGCSDDPTLSSSTISQPHSDDPFLRPILSDLSHLVTLPIDRTYKWKHTPQETDNVMKSVNHDNKIMAHDLPDQKNFEQQILKTSQCDVTTDKENLPTTPSLASLDRVESGGSPKYFTPECTPTQHSVWSPPSEVTRGPVSSENPFPGKSLVAEKDLSKPSNSDSARLPHENNDSSKFGNVDNSVLVALSNPATHISDLSSQLYFIPNSTPLTPETSKFPYPSSASFISPLQDLEYRQSLDIMTEQLAENFNQSNYPNQDIKIQNVVIQSVIYSSDLDSSESDETISVTSSNDPDQSSWQRVQGSTQALDRILAKTVLRKNRQILATLFHRWKGRFQQKLDLLDILAYWQGKARKTISPALNRKEMKFQVQRNHDIVSKCFDNWRSQYEQAQKVYCYRKERLMIWYFQYWHEWARNNGLRKEKADNFYSQKLKFKVFQALKKRRLLKLVVKQKEIACRKQQLSSILRRWHSFTQHTRYQRSTLYKLTTEKNFTFKALCFNNWSCETMKRKMADITRRRNLTRNVVRAWKKVTDYNVYEEQRFKRIGTLVEIHSKEAVLVKWLDEVLLKSKVNSLQRKHLLIQIVECWNAWKDKTALKRSDKLYNKFLKKRFFRRWTTVLRMRRERNEKIRAILRRWHAMARRSKKLSRMADDSRYTSNKLITEISFNVWLITWEQAQKSRLHYEQNIVSRIFCAWQAWSHKKRALQRAIENHLMFRSKERFAIAWHTWKHRYKIRVADINGIILYKKSAAVRTMRFLWLAWRRKKLENDSSKFYSRKLLHHAMESWLVKFQKMKRVERLHSSLVNKRLRRVFLAWHQHVTLVKNEQTIICNIGQSRCGIVTMTTFVTWLKAYKNNKLAESFNDRRLKRRSFESLVSWWRRNQSLQNSFSRAVHIVGVTMLSLCMSQWKLLFRNSRMMEVSCDQMIELKKMKMQRNLWLKWLREKEKLDIKKLRHHNIVVDAAKKWRTYATNRANNRQIKEERTVMVERFRHKWLCKIYFSYWRREYESDRLRGVFLTRLMERCWSIWSDQTTMSLCATSMSSHRMLQSSWRIWRLEFVKSKVVKDSMKDRDHDLLGTVFKSWRSLIVQMKTGKPKHNPMQLLSSNSNHRRSRIPVLQK